MYDMAVTTKMSRPCIFKFFHIPILCPTIMICNGLAVRLYSFSTKNDSKTGSTVRGKKTGLHLIDRFFAPIEGTGEMTDQNYENSQCKIMAGITCPKHTSVG